MEAVADELAERIAAGAAALACGDPLDEATDVGTVIDEAGARSYRGAVEDAVGGGARLLYGGERDGALLTPAVLDHVPPDAELVATRDLRAGCADHPRRATSTRRSPSPTRTPYALSSGVCTFDWRAIARCVRELRAGTVNIREVPGWRTELTPFGGIGDSGLGVKEGVREAMRAMSLHKALHAALGVSDAETVEEIVAACELDGGAALRRRARRPAPARAPVRGAGRGRERRRRLRDRLPAPRHRARARCGRDRL